ncbi:MAG: hypothetical protein A2268_11610 [Candidatus Raymondbacteria bacterium RifOxyA12_full_50_37]|uniref:Uncharacterized protein n=1 Tax=Candidatus Raymondbacteria bacterium RIFOXYD12_FULL_49_13 TaxID=1817890 RepID=A0A1F7F3M4_UNCRA|nr:MAG: hypothetical protein A2268_11610 [Candidatus Raymondbacteria bacterium RifOxyA12_full_50_37]OGJ85984.1 MAG: hypothetical protein A2248_00445 [Candidatus Raymondbacteria bacterium RIFOXYA2_FULL_49_16]OGJ90090.1 MAG: hypothetical protein A2350_07985 [Candidatus Raymondbacteria bacterium RifOxyB12_full_50_8]OGJ97134.1 MAG: hypothetical protein A2453_12475 [Candidatus Raymondbacteria bacterium RIFOXYC2_FULL_50_21]OGK01163.1 MAG: hypothetical protein A2519_01420 [Candidatus Raymondbacteria b
MKKNILACLTCLFLAGCGIFDPRPSDPPSDFGANSYETYQDILNELHDMYATRNTESMSAIFPPEDTDFTFEADSLDSAAMHATARTWHRNDEIEVTRSILTNDSIIDFIHNTYPINTGADSVTVDWGYALMLSDSTHIKGTSRFTIQRYVNRYYLTRWTDRADSTGPGVKSWGRWKMEN